ncbi:hypothetical protein [Halalkalibacter krulwichiae]|nr:hypothetical protein [Halalkalibacter krulwichiae]
MSIQSTAKRFQKEKNEIALLRRNGLEWPKVFPVSIRQTLFPTIFQTKRE